MTLIELMGDGFVGVNGFIRVNRLVGMDPADIGVFPEPRQLTFGIPAGIGLDMGDGFIQGGIPVKVLEYLFISNGLKRIMVTVWQQRLYFFDQSLFDHLVNAGMDPAAQFFFGKVQADLADAERALPDGGAAKAKDRPARGQADFERPEQSLRIKSLAFGKEGGVVEAYFLLEPADTVEVILLLETAADSGIHGGDVIEAIGKCLNIKPGAADHDGDRVLTKDLGRPLQGQFFENGGVDFLPDGMRVNEIVMNGVELCL